MDDIKREELEKACKKIHKVRTRMAAVRMVRVLNISVEETANLQVRCPTWVRDWLRHYDERRPPGSSDAAGPEGFRETLCKASIVASLKARKRISLQEQKRQSCIPPKALRA